MTGFKPASDVVYKGCIHLCADRRKITFRFGENRHFHVGVDTFEDYAASMEAAQSWSIKARLLEDAINDPHITGFQLCELKKLLRCEEGC